MFLTVLVNNNNIGPLLPIKNFMNIKKRGFVIFAESPNTMWAAKNWGLLMWWHCRFSAVCPPVWWGTNRSSWVSSPNQVLIKRSLSKLRSYWRRLGASWSSSLWTSSVRRTSCPQWAPKKPWCPLRSGPDGTKSEPQKIRSASSMKGIQITVADETLFVKHHTNQYEGAKDIKTNCLDMSFVMEQMDRFILFYTFYQCY